MVTAKDYLSQYRCLDESINSKIEQIEELREIAARVTAPQSDGGGHSGGNTDRIGSIVAKIVDMETEVNAEIDRLVDLRREITDTINHVENMTLRLLLEMNYLQGKSFETIAYKCGYSWRHTMRLHKRALELVDDVIACHM